MKKSFFVGALLLCVAVLLVATTGVAQNQRIGTSAASELLIPIGARDLAQGGATIAGSSGLESIHWNPAGVSRMNGTAEGMFSTMRYIADINVAYGAVGAKFGEFGSVALSLKNLSFGDIPATTVDDPEGLAGATFSPSFITVGLTYSRLITDAASVGVTAKIINETIARVSATGLAFDIGVQYHGLLNVPGLQLGVTIKNIGPQMKYDGSGLLRTATASEGLRPEQFYKSEAAGFELPSMIEIGASYVGAVQDNMMYTVSGSYTSNNLYVDEYRIGGEYGISLSGVHLYARGGYSFLPQVENKEDRIFGGTVGFGVAYNTGGTTLSVDYAYRQVDLFGGNNILSLKVGL
ncbi:MAG: hypothetical protein H6Q31_364 [Bacteroidetes bacterium]|jgi:hypothetical protein|nr:hypothetical protein [Bacteroidota bacterium]